MSDLEQSGSRKQPPRWLRPVLYAAAVLFIAWQISVMGWKTSGPAQQPRREDEAWVVDRDTSPRQDGIAVVYVRDERPDAGSESKLIHDMLQRHAKMLSQFAGEHDQIKLRTGLLTLDSRSPRFVHLTESVFSVHPQPLEVSLQPPRENLFESLAEPVLDAPVDSIRNRPQIPAEKLAHALSTLYAHALKTRLNNITLVIITAAPLESELQEMISLIESQPDNTKVIVIKPAEVASTQPGQAKQSDDSLELLQVRLEEAAATFGYQ